MRYMIHRFGCILIFCVFLFLSLAAMVGMFCAARDGEIMRGCGISLGLACSLWICVRFMDEFYRQTKKYYKHKGIDIDD